MKNFLFSKSGIVMLAFTGIAGYFVWTEHQAHLAQYWPWLFLLACPLMHLFMHHGHGDDHGRHHDGDKASHTDKGPPIQTGTHASVPRAARPNDQSR